MQRVAYLDIAKGIGITLVVFGHIVHLPEVRAWIWSFHMPLFFFISGVFFNASIPLDVFVKKKLKALVLPYLVFFVLTFLYWLLFERNFRGSEYSVLHQMAGLPYGTYEGSHLNFNGALWFLPCLFSTEMLFYPIVKMCSKPLRMAGVMSCFVIGQYLSKYCIHLPWGIHAALFATCFMWIGYEMKTLILQARESAVGSYVWLLLFVVSCGLLTCNVPKHVVSIDTANLQYMILASIGIIMLLSISLIGGGKFAVAEYLGRNSLVILAFQEQTYRLIIGVISKLLVIDAETLRQNLVYSVLLSAITLLAIWPMICAWNKWCKPQIDQLIKI